MNNSIATKHFPRVVSQNNRFWLFNPVLKKRYENRPEERVRLQWVEYIIHQTDWKSTRIGFEAPVKLPNQENKLRADLILYSKEMAPKILIECKSDSVSLNTAVAVQAARYNSQVMAEYLVLTNGLEDYWFKNNGDEVQQTDSVLQKKCALSEVERGVGYWAKRGFCSIQSNQQITGWVENALKIFWSDRFKGRLQYLDFQGSILPVPMNQYYKLFDLDSKRRLAITFLGEPSSNSMIIGILNEEGTNQGIFSLDLDKLFSNEEDAITVYRGDRQRKISSKKLHDLNMAEFRDDQIEKLPNTIIKFFD